MVVTRRGPQAARAASAPAPMRLHCDFNPVRLAAAGPQLNIGVNKTGETLNPVQNGLKFELDSRAPALRVCLFLNCNLLDRAPPGYSSTPLGRPDAFNRPERKEPEIPNANLTSGSSLWPKGQGGEAWRRGFDLDASARVISWGPLWSAFGISGSVIPSKPWTSYLNLTHKFCYTAEHAFEAEDGLRGEE